VISTAQRPVPLEHYLYAGKALHKIVDEKRAFLSEGYAIFLDILLIAEQTVSYKAASEALRRKQDKEREAAGLPPVQRMGARAAAPQRGTSRGGQRGGQPAPRGRGSTAPVARGGSARTFHHEDKNVYVHLLGHLKKLALLPVVVFTFSKKRCEDNAATLTNADLSTAVEKSEVHIAVERALSRLKGRPHYWSTGVKFDR
jgi:antiviral helicase SKI2